MRIKVTAPGSLMLMGEHAVLFGQRALACAVDKYITVMLTPRTDRVVTIDSALAQYSSNLDNLTEDPSLSFVLAAIKRQLVKLPAGFDLQIVSEFSHTVGLGSSAAVTAAVVTALQAYIGREAVDADFLFDEALAVVHEVQDGRGSGTDLVAAVYGGVVGYTAATDDAGPMIKALQGRPEISLFYVGYKMKTPDVLKFVEGKAQRYPWLYSGIYRLMGETTEEAETAVDNSDWQRFGELMNIYQGLMDALGVNDKKLAEIIYTLRQNPSITGAKISGSGLGDCVISLGKPVDLPLSYEEIPVSVSAEGVTIELI
ncbi:mevalonate kinase [Amphritea japonica]|uniref:Mevalonate kinase n=1 Tax=Amphritea japonica ATCC BAA-1530 TaxID=1278309 RepID=A0A7R6PD34_9GAMM|nr:mevalonate kinase [Amphritea japonica]BBB27203.1 mevalonate kinase [Amphritea japonica ATCC BAA-1530]